MNKITLYFLTAFFVLFAYPVFSQERSKQLINTDWKYRVHEQAGAEFIVYEDKEWETVQLPHDASIYGPFFRDSLGGNVRNGYRPRNIGWYRKHLFLQQRDANKKYILEFEGVYRAAKVWVNEKYCGQFLNGYLDFEMDITDKIKQGDNLIAVRYDNTFKESSRWYTGEGINRNVYLHTVNKLHVARYGTYIATPVISAGNALVVIETDIVNTFSDSIGCRLVTDIFSPRGQIVATAVAIVPLKSDSNYKFHQEVNVKNPLLWHLKTPNLYKAVSKLYKGKELSDVYETTFGIREIEFNTAHGFLLNGKKVFLNGVCLHHDLGPLGAASFDAGWEKRLTILKNELGCNAIRLSHNPYPKYVLDWCDRNGMLVFDEAYDKWNNQYYGPGEDFNKYWRTDVETFIRRDRNNPSVFIWSVGNEVLQQIHGTDHSGVPLLRDMINFVHKLEPTRKVTAALFPNRWNMVRSKDTAYVDPHQMAFHMDVMSVNYMENYFAGDRLKYPQLIPLVSEMTTGLRGENYFIYDHSYAAGQFYWGGTEYIGESFGWPSKGWINGIIDFSNKLKPIGYSIKSFYKAEEPMVFAAVVDEKAAQEKFWNNVKIKMLPSASHWNWQGKDSLRLQVYSNCEEVELRLNGKPLANKKMTPGLQNYFAQTVAYAPGELQAIGKNNGIVVARQLLKTAGEAYQIILETDKKALKANGLDLAYLTAKVVDKNGVLVPSSSFNIKFTVSGNGTNAGVVNGDITSNELFQADNRSVYNGECQLIVRSATKAGSLKVEATSANLKPASVSINVK